MTPPARPAAELFDADIERDGIRWSGALDAGGRGLAALDTITKQIARGETPDLAGLDAARAELHLELAGARRLAELGKLSTVQAEGNDALARIDLGAVNRVLGQGRDLAAHLAPAPPPLPPSAADRVRELIGKGPIVRAPTGIDILDTMTGGGLRGGKLFTAIGGAPEAGKTSLAVQFAVGLARQGYAVVFLCADEPREGILDRIGQQFGLVKEQLEARNPEALAWLGQALLDLPNLLILDQDEDGWTIESAGAVLIELARALGSRGIVFVGDSIQKLRAAGTDDARDPRLRAAAVVRALQLFGARTEAIVIATSEIGRINYQNDGKPPPNAMAAFKESGDIEYAMRLGLVLYPVKDDPDLVRVKVPKAKGAQRGRFMLRRDAARCTYAEELDDGGAERSEKSKGEAAPATSTASRAPALVERARYILATHPEGVAGKDVWVALMERNKTKAREAIHWLLGMNEVDNKGSDTRPRYHLRTATAPPPSVPANDSK